MSKNIDDSEIIDVRQEVMDIIRRTGCTSAQLSDSIRRATDYWTAKYMKQQARDDVVEQSAAVEDTDIVVPVRNGFRGEEIGVATLKATGSAGIYLAQIEMFGGTASGYVHLPIKRGDTFNHMTIAGKDEDGNQ